MVFFFQPQARRGFTIHVVVGGFDQSRFYIDTSRCSLWVSGFHGIRSGSFLLHRHLFQGSEAKAAKRHRSTKATAAEEQASTFDSLVPWRWKFLSGPTRWPKEHVSFPIAFRARARTCAGGSKSSPWSPESAEKRPTRRKSPKETGRSSGLFGSLQVLFVHPSAVVYTVV